ncbi:hypothetical protein L228DRAFT_244086 [Xylona heveae TC161]|uniref:Uncharacterized protein n=1 Tax=Xylona heveae (strain CBS 132557 / TC161) TaxID=1328760 RepID=A0A165IRM1_XYLHT|nr:hypothetical protein L228DRAFT_244086 [Xylona heveae TC161]KZF25285.1 hypothetical protein L228DRAFT_244086 [Xylona heveae TC161]
MALQTPSPMVSSPDPLGNSQESSYFTLSSPRKAPRTPLADSSNNARSLQLQNFVLQTPPINSAGKIRSSPARTSAQTENIISPWRIRVTVEAEHDAGQENAESLLFANQKISSTKGQAVRTTTTSIPLKEPGSSSPRKPGRPRKNGNGTPVRKSSGTPKPRSVKGRKTLESEVDGDKFPTPVGRRSVSLKHFATTTNEGISISSDELSLAFRDQPDFEQTPIIGIQKRRTDQSLSKSAVISNASRKASSPAKLVGNTPSNGRNSVHAPTRNASKLIERPNDSISGNLNSYSEERDEVRDLPEFDSILDSEGFSMVSISSLPSAKEHLSSPALLEEANSNVRQGSLHDGFSRISNRSTNAKVNNHTAPQIGSSFLAARPKSRISYESSLMSQERNIEKLDSSTIMMSSPPQLLTRNPAEVNQTPSVAFSSPQLPPPPPRQSPAKHDHHFKSGEDGKLSGVIQAGVSLQSVTDSNASEGSPQNSPAKGSFGQSTLS